MTDASEPAEISLCASILAKAFIENNGSAFAGQHDALKEYLRHNHKTDDEALAGAISKVEELAKKYTCLPAFVLEGKVRWLESHGVRPFQGPPSAHRVLTVREHEEKTNQRDGVDEKEEKNKIDPGLDANVIDGNIHLAFPISSIDNLCEPIISVSKDDGVNNSISHKSEVICHLDAGATQQNNLSELKYEFVEMQEISHGCSDMLLNAGETDLNSYYQTPSLSKKKKNKKKKKKSKSEASTTAAEVEAKVFSEKVEVSGKSSRNLRRRKFLRSRKELKKEASSDNIIGTKDELPEDINFEESDTKSKRKLISKKQTQISENMLGSEQGNALIRNDLMMHDAACHDQTTEYALVREMNRTVANRNVNSITDASRKGKKKKSNISNTGVRKDGRTEFSKSQENPNESTASTITSTRSSCTPVFTTVPSCTKVIHSLDSVGGSIASSSEDNSSTASSGAMDLNNTEFGLLSQKVFFLTQSTSTATDNSTKKETKTSVSRNVMHFGTPLEDQENAKCDSLKETEVKTLLYNDLGLEFFGGQHTDSKHETSFGSCDDPGLINFVCDSDKISSASQKDHRNGKKVFSNTMEVVPNHYYCCNNTDFKNDEKLSSSGHSMSALNTPHRAEKFDYAGAVQFIWTEWMRISS